MRIVLVNKFARVTGGADQHCLMLAGALRDRGHEVSLLSTADRANEDDIGEFIECTVTTSNRVALRLREQATVARKAFWNADASRAMERLVLEFHPDLVHAHKLYPQLSVSPLVAARRARLPIVQTVHDYEFVGASSYDHRGRLWDREESHLRFRALNSSLFGVKWLCHRRVVDRWIAVSDYVATALKRRGIKADVIPNFTVAHPPSTENAARRDGIAFVGRLIREKGVRDVVRLAELLPHARILVAGDGPERDMVTTAAIVRPNLRFVGRVDRAAVSHLLGEARIAVVPSCWEEPGAQIVLEAMGAGTPLVVYRAGGIAQYVESSGAGLVVERRPEALADACSTLLSDNAAWKRHADAGRAALATVHSPDAHCASLERIYSSVMRP